MLGAAEVTGAGPPQSSYWLTVAPPGPLPPPGLSIPRICAPTVQRPVIHPLSSPSNRLCVTSLNSDIPPTVATLLMDVTFYSSGLKDRLVSSSGNCGPTRFSFSLIEGYISLVMDVQTQQR